MNGTDRSKLFLIFAFGGLFEVLAFSEFLNETFSVSFFYVGLSLGIIFIVFGYVQYIRIKEKEKLEL